MFGATDAGNVLQCIKGFFSFWLFMCYTLWTHFPFSYLSKIIPFFSILKFFFLPKIFQILSHFECCILLPMNLQRIFSYHQNVKITFRAFSPFSKAHSRSFHCIAFALCVHNFIDFHHTISREFFHNFNTFFFV